MATVLITGINGFIGQRLARLLHADHEIVGIGRPITCAVSTVQHYYSGDVASEADVTSLFQQHDIDVIYHLASPTEHHAIVADRESTLAMNLRASVNLLMAMHATNAQKFIYCSTGKVYGHMTGQGLSESDPVNPSNQLGKIKQLTEEVVRFFSDQSDKSVVIARIFNVYGPGQRETFVIPTILRQLKSGKVHLGNLDDGRDYIHVEDLISALRIIGTAPFKRGLDVVNVGYGEPVTVRDIIVKLEKLLGRNIHVEVEQNKLRGDEYRSEYANNSKLRAMGWTPRLDLLDGLKSCIEYYATELAPWKQ